MSELTCIDLFCGCGGFSLGMKRAGFKVLAAIDFNKEAIETFKTNFKDDGTICLHKDLTNYSPHQLAARMKVNSVDVIVGGPPCQGFSTVRQVDAANHGTRVRKDKRRYLYRVFLDYVAVFRPRVFVMENVLGIQSAAKGKFFTRIQAEGRALGYRVQAQVEESWKLGVPQKRRRQLVIGVRNDIPGYFATELRPSKSAPTKAVKLWDAIGDLPPLSAGEGSDLCDYDLNRRTQHLEVRESTAATYLTNVLEVEKASHLTAHKARPHSERDLRDFERLREGEHSGEAEDRGERMEFLYKRSCFKDRYKRQHREDFCSTIVAHLSKDGLGFIHPIQKRSLTPREAARIQSFPDWFVFPIARTHQFRVIGNAVPPLVGEAVGIEIKEFFQGHQTPRANVTQETVPPSRTEAAANVQRLAGLDRRALRLISKESFLNGWHSLLFLFPNLHPDSALDHGDDIHFVSADQLALPAFEELLSRTYDRSGWPVALALIGEEAWRRYRNNELCEFEFYCAEAQEAGIYDRSQQPKPTSPSNTFDKGRLSSLSQKEAIT